MSLRKNIVWTLTGNIVYASCQWGIVVILAKLTNAKVLGSFSLALAVTTPIFVLSRFQLRGVQATDVKDDYSFGHYFGLRLIASLSAIAIVIAMAFISYNGKTAWIIVAVGLSKIFESISDVFYGLMQKYERMDQVGLSKMIKAPLSLFFLGSIIFFTHDLFFGVLGLSAAWCAILLFFDLPNSRILLSSNSKCNGVSPIFDIKIMLKLFFLALPLGCSMALGSLKTSIPRIFIEKYFNLNELGIFAAVSYPVLTGGIVINAIGQSVAPRLAFLYINRDVSDFQKLLLYLLLSGAGIGFVGIFLFYLFGEYVLIIAYSEEFAKYNDILIGMMIAGSLAYINAFMGVGLTAMRLFFIQLPIVSLSTLVMLAGSWFIIPKFGLAGAVSVIIATNTITLIIVSIVMLIKLKFEKIWIR